MATFLDTLFTPLKNAGLDYHISKSPYTATALSSLDTPELLIDALTSTLESTFTITLPSSDKATLTITIRTSLAPPVQGTEYALKTSDISSSGVHIPNKIPRITSDEEVQQMVMRILNLGLLAVIEATSQEHAISLPPPDGMSPKQTSKNPPAQNRAAYEPTVPSWNATDPQNNELSKSFPVSQSPDRKSARMRIIASEGKLFIKWAWIRGAVGGSEYVWTADDATDMEDGKTLNEFVNEAAV